MLRIVLTLYVMVALCFVCPAQTPKSPAPAEAKKPTMEVYANLLQLMRGVLYPASNVIFAAQNDNPGDLKKPAGKDPSMATDPLVSTFGGWQAVENAALALEESSNLLLIPGRTCANGTPVPINNPDWSKFVQELRDAGMKAYKAAQSTNMDAMVDVSEIMTNACGNCHKKWREKPLAARCK